MLTSRFLDWNAILRIIMWLNWEKFDFHRTKMCILDLKNLSVSSLVGQRIVVADRHHLDLRACGSVFRRDGNRRNRSRVSGGHTARIA